MTEQYSETQSDLEKMEKPLPWTQRNGFPDWLTASIWLIIAFIGFQLIANVLAFVFILAQEGFKIDPANLLSLISQHMRWVFVGNSIGQVSILAISTWFISSVVVRKSEKLRFFRLEKGIQIGKTVGLSILIMVAIQPMIWLLSYMNQLFPFPEGYLNFENEQMKILIDFLTKEKSLLFILINVAVVPAMCEEILFRGFIFRLYTNSTGWFWGIFISGFLFGLYHFKLTQLIPLSLIGMLLAWLTYKSGSLIPAIVAHFVNNGGSVVAAFYYPEYAFSVGTETLPPFWISLASITLTIGFLYSFNLVTSKKAVN